MTDQERRMHEEIAEHEKWLAVYSTPAPSPSAVERAKAVAREAMNSERGGSSLRAWKVWQGVTAAAAAIALCVFVGTLTKSKSPTDISQFAERDPIPVLPILSREETESATVFDDDLSELEAWSAQANWGMSGASLYELMDEALEQDSNTSPGDSNGSS